MFGNFLPFHIVREVIMTRGSGEWAPLPLRLVMGFAFMFHGWPKVFTGAGHQGFVGNLHMLGVPAPEVSAWLLGVLEVLGGLALLAGAFITVFGLLLVVHQLGALFKVHLAAGFSFVHVTGMSPTGPVFGLPGYEVNLLFIAGLLALILGGAGALSVDGMRARRGDAGMS
jgi:putative oxidoreductase